MCRKSIRTPCFLRQAGCSMPLPPRHGCLCWFWTALPAMPAVRWMARAAGAARRRRLWLAVGLNLGLLAGLKALGAALAGLNAAPGCAGGAGGHRPVCLGTALFPDTAAGHQLFHPAGHWLRGGCVQGKMPCAAERGAFLPVHKLFRLYFLRTHHAGRQLSAAASGAAPLLMRTKPSPALC